MKRFVALISACVLFNVAAVAQQCAISSPVAAGTIAIGTPGAVAADTSGNVYFTTSNCVLKLDGHAMLTRIAGTAASGYSGDGAAAISAQLNAPAGLAVDSSGNIYVADSGNNSVRIIASTGNITTIAGTGTSGYSGDGGSASAATLNAPQGLAFDNYGNLYIADTNNNVIRKLASTGIITTAAGNGTAGYAYDGFFARQGELNLPTGVAVSTGNLYIADSANNRVRLVTAAHLITTLAGDGTAGFSGDNDFEGQDEDAELNTPTAVASDPLGLNIFISDTGNGRIRQVLPDTIITTVAGGGSSALGNPAGIALDSNGNLYIADSKNGHIMKMSPTGALTIVAGK